MQRVKNRQIIDLAKDRPCLDCGIKYPPIVMDFDHLPGFQKDDNVASMLNRTEGQIVREIAKCEVVCANCHRLRTLKRKTGHGLIEKLKVVG